MRRSRADALTPDEYRNRAVRLCDDTETAINDPESQENDERAEEETLLKPKKTAKTDAMSLVSTSSYTEQGLRRKLESRERYTKDEIEEAIEYVKGFGYVNDKRLAENAIYKLSERLWGKKKICYYLSGKGISEEVIDSLDFSEIDFVSNCERLMSKYAGKPIEKAMRAAYNAGFSPDEINEAKRNLEGSLV